MNRLPIAPAVLALFLAAPPAARADGPATSDPAAPPTLGPGGLFSLALPRLDLGVPSLDAVAWIPRVPPADPNDPPPANQEDYPHGRRHGYEPAWSSPVQLHGGFFDPNGGGSNSFAFGFRGGPAVDEHIQLGLGMDWYHQSEDQRDVVGQTVQAGRPVTVTRELAHASSDLLPLQAFAQVSFGDGGPVIPFAGIAGEYQVLFLNATDFQTGADYNATFGGWGWQAWGGAALPLSRRSRLFGEAFYNSGEVARDVSDPATGVTYQETIDASGVGARFGLSWGF